MLKIYIIDDEELIVKELCQLIDYQQYGYQVVGYQTDPYAAIDEIMLLKPHLVISDVSMGKMNGFQLFDKLRPVLSTIKFCFLSAYDNFEYVQEAVRLGAIRYLRKPIRIPELINLLEDIKKNVTEDFNNQVFSNIVNHTFYEDDKTLENLFRENPNLPQKSYGHVVAFMGDNKVASLDGVSPFYQLLYSDENMSLFLTGEIDFDNLNALSQVSSVSCGVSELFFDYDKIAKHLRVARIASKQKFISHHNEVTKYVLNKNIEVVMNEINKSRNRYELCSVIMKLKDLINEYEIKSYDLQKIYKHIIFNMIKFDVISYDDFSSDISVLDNYNDLDAMIDDLLSNFEESHNVEETGSIVGKVIRELEQNVDKRLTLSYFANKYNYNSSYFSQLFKKICNCSFAEYFINLKMDKAKMLISSTDLSLTTIAIEVGYDDYYHFSKMFKKYTGKSPTDYRDVYMKKPH